MTSQKRVLGSFVKGFSNVRQPRSIAQTLMPVVAFVALANLGCTTSIAATYPHLERRSVCLRVPGIESDASEFIFAEGKIPVSNLHPEVVDRVAPTARTVFEFDQNVDSSSTRYLPAPYNELTCPQRFSILPSGDAKTSPLPDASLDLSVYKRPTESKPVPQPITQQLARCPSASAARLGAVSYTMNFNVYIDEQGAAGSAYVKTSTLGDRDTEACMAAVLRKTQWPAPEAESSVAVTPASKLFIAKEPSNLPNVKDLLTEILRNSKPADFSKPYRATLALGPLFVGVTVGVTIFLLPRDTAPRCATEMNQITRQPYTSIEECEQVLRLSPEEILQRRLAHIKATQPQAPPAPAPQAQPQPQPQPAQPQPQPQPAQSDCPENESFVPDHTDNATGCTDKKDNLQCYAKRHPPCAGVHTHGILTYQKMRGGVCKELKKKVVHCEGPFVVSGVCGSVSTTLCGKEGSETSGFFDD